MLKQTITPGRQRTALNEIDFSVLVRQKVMDNGRMGTVFVWWLEVEERKPTDLQDLLDDITAAVELGKEWAEDEGQPSSEVLK